MRVLLVVLFACCTAWAARAAPARGLEVRYRPPAGLEQGLVGETLLYRKSHAIVIGIDAYGKLPALTGAVRDARNVAEAFRARGMDVTLLLDREATRARITELLGDELPGRLGEQDRVLIYFAGHGISVGQGERAMGYLMPVNGDRAKVRSSGISMREIQAWFADYASKHVMFVADACYSGLALSTRAAGLPPTIPEYLRRVLAKRVRLALTAGGAGEEAHEWRGEGLFTHYFLEGINGAADANRDGLVTSDELAAYVKPNVAQTAIDQFRAAQNPLLGRSGEGEFLFLASAQAPGAVVSTGVTLRPAGAGADKEALFWQSIADSDDPDVFAAYLAQYPNGTFAGLAKIKRDKLGKMQVAAVVVPPKPKTSSRVQPAVGIYPHGVGDVFRDCAGCPEMVVVPAGDFMMGSNGYTDAIPVHRVTISRPIAVGVYEVTFDEWDACVSAGGCNGYRPKDEGWGRGRRPVMNVNLKDARVYAAWLTAKTGKTYRLPSESEWEYVARAGTTTKYWWGAEIGHGNANCKGCGSDWDFEQTAPVGSFRPNAFGLYDVHGNVEEWVEDCYHDSYSGAPSDGRVWSGGECGWRVRRGGAWYFNPTYLPSGYRGKYWPESRHAVNGFRLARTLK